MNYDQNVHEDRLMSAQYARVYYSIVPPIPNPRENILVVTPSPILVICNPMQTYSSVNL